MACIAPDGTTPSLSDPAPFLVALDKKGISKVGHSAMNRLEGFGGLGWRRWAGLGGLWLVSLFWGTPKRGTHCTSISALHFSTTSGEALQAQVGDVQGTELA